MEKTKRLSVSQNSLYNSIGTIIFCFCQWVISSLLVVHLSAEEKAVSNAGLLQLAISVTNIFFAISTYNMRTYQISDTDNKYSYGDYIGTRFVTAIIAVVLCVVYVIVLGYSLKSALCIVLYMIFKLNETFSDVLHAIDQKNRRMDYVGVSFIIRGVLMVIAFAATIKITGNVLPSILAMAVVTFGVVALYDVNKTRTFGSIRPVFDKKTISKLLATCLPTVIASASFTAVASVPRQVLEGVCGEEALGFYGTVATPLMFVQVMATSIFNPMLTELAEFYNEGRIREFVKRIFKNFGLLLCIAAFVCVCVIFLGKFAIGLVFGRKFVPYTYLMYGIIGCTTMYVISWLCTNVLIIMRKLKVCMFASLTALVIAVLLSRPLINVFGMNGVSFSVIMAYAVHMSVCSIMILKTLKSRRKTVSYTNTDHTYALCAYKTSEYLEDCVKSLLSQTVKSNILIVTSTPNEHISLVAEKYNIPVFINEGEKGIGGDWNFAYSKADTPLVTIAHQDDIYESSYTEEMLVFINKSKKPIIYFSGYGELRNGEKVYSNPILKIKKLMLSPLKTKVFWTSRFIRRRILSLGNGICCPAVTYVKEKVGPAPFTNDYLSNIDWQQWEIQSRKKGSFVYNCRPLMCHRIHEESTTSEIIGDNKRTLEDYDMFCKFWPRPIAKIISKAYSKSEESNNV